MSSGLPEINASTKVLAPQNKYSLTAMDRSAESTSRFRKKAEATLHGDGRATSCRRGEPRGNRSLFSTVPPTVALLQKQASCEPVPEQQGHAAAQKDALTERWRSCLLHYETDLRELVSAGPMEPPTMSRIIKVLQLYDGVCRRAADTLSPHLAELLRLFRIEFCRAIFSQGKLETAPTFLGTTAANDVYGVSGSAEEDTSAYFEQVQSLTRENNIIAQQLLKDTSKVDVMELQHEIKRLEENINLCENEIERLSRQFEYAMEQYREAVKTAQVEQEEHAAKMAIAESELQKLTVNNKDLQLQLFRLRKEAAGDKAKMLKDQYRQLRMSKMSFFAELFSESDERLSLLVLLSQLESRVNEALDSYDDSYMMAQFNLSEQLELRRKMEADVVVLLEEIHLSSQHFRRLVPPARQGFNEAGTHSGSRQRRRTFHSASSLDNKENADVTDSYVTMLFDSKIYEKLMYREKARRRVVLGRKSHSIVELCSKEGSACGKPCEEGSSTTRSNPPLPHPKGHVRVYQTDSVAPSLFPAESKVVLFSKSAEKCPEKSTEPDLLDGAFYMTRDEWIKRMLNTMFVTDEHEKKTPSGVVWVPQAQGEVVAPETLMPRLLRQPLVDLNTQRLFGGIDIFTGHNPAQNNFLCTLSQIDPSFPIVLPDETNFIRIKYKNTLLPATVGHHAEETDGARQERPGTGGGDGMGGGGRLNSGLTCAPLDTSFRAGRSLSMSLSPPTKSINRPHTLLSKQSSGVFNTLRTWGGKTLFEEEQETSEAERKTIFNAYENFKVFRELNEPPFYNKNNTGKIIMRVTGSITSNTPVVFYRLNPLSPNRAPEWTLYQQLFGGFRCLTPRALDPTLIDNILLGACERHFERLDQRYTICSTEASTRATSSQMAFTISERLFREAYELSDFQKALVDELEAHYCYPELVAKTLYELLCYIDAAAPRDSLYNLYLEVIRGFKPATYIHFVCRMLFHVSYSWPLSDLEKSVSRDEVLATLRYIYRNTDSLVHVDVNEVMNEYTRSTRPTAYTLASMRNFIASAILHQEESILINLSSLFKNKCEADDMQQLKYEHYSQVALKYWIEKSSQKAVVRFLSMTLGFNRTAFLSCADLALVAASYWCSNLFG